MDIGSDERLNTGFDSLLEEELAQIGSSCVATAVATGSRFWDDAELELKIRRLFKTQIASDEIHQASPL